jgi:hypothetical protein
MSMSKTSKNKALTIRHRGQSWQVDFGTRDGTRDGKRVQRSFKTKQDAKTAIESHVEERRLEKIDNQNRRVAIFDLTDRQRIDAKSRPNSHV